MIICSRLTTIMASNHVFSFAGYGHLVVPKSTQGCRMHAGIPKTLNPYLLTKTRWHNC